MAVRIEPKTAPASGSCSQSLRAVVTNSRSSAGPPKTGQVGCDAGKARRSVSRPCASKRTTTPSPQAADHSRRRHRLPRRPVRRRPSATARRRAARQPTVGVIGQGPDRARRRVGVVERPAVGLKLSELPTIPGGDGGRSTFSPPDADAGRLRAVIPADRGAVRIEHAEHEAPLRIAAAVVDRRCAAHRPRPASAGRSRRWRGRTAPRRTPVQAAADPGPRTARSCPAAPASTTA